MHVHVAISCGIDILLKNVFATLILIAVQVLLALLLLVWKVLEILNGFV